MSNLILPGNTREEFLYGTLIGATTKTPAAMMKYPKSLADKHGVDLTSEEPFDENGNMLIFYLTNRVFETDEESGLEASRYEFYGAKRNEADPKVENIEDLNGTKDGYVYIPKETREGRHEDAYFLSSISEEEFRTRTERGMYEEVSWSPFGDVRTATTTDASNLEHNPLMRAWK